MTTRHLSDQTNKALTAAAQMGGDVHVLVAGKGCKAVADAAAKLSGVKKVLLADDATLEQHVAEPLAALIVSLASSYDAIVCCRHHNRQECHAARGSPARRHADFGSHRGR